MRTSILIKFSRSRFRTREFFRLFFFVFSSNTPSNCILRRRSVSIFSIFKIFFLSRDILFGSVESATRDEHLMFVRLRPREDEIDDRYTVSEEAQARRKIMFDIFNRLRIVEDVVLFC